MTLYFFDTAARRLIAVDEDLGTHRVIDPIGAPSPDVLPLDIPRPKKGRQKAEPTDAPVKKRRGRPPGTPKVKKVEPRKSTVNARDYMKVRPLLDEGLNSEEISERTGLPLEQVNHIVVKLREKYGDQFE